MVPLIKNLNSTGPEIAHSPPKSHSHQQLDSHIPLPHRPLPNFASDTIMHIKVHAVPLPPVLKESRESILSNYLCDIPPREFFVRLAGRDLKYHRIHAVACFGFESALY